MSNMLSTAIHRRRFGIATTLGIALGWFAAVSCGSSNDYKGGTLNGLPGSAATQEQVDHGRYLVIAGGCSDCHNRGKDDPSDPMWLAGYVDGTPGQPFQIGPFKVYPKNLTPDPATGLGSVTDRQVFNALRFGLHPDEAPDAEITSTTPGQGNFPATPHYLGPPMPWPAIRHMTDDDLWSVVAYLKHGIKAVNNAVPESDAPPDFWASAYLPEIVGPAVIPAYPTSSEAFVP